MRQANRSQYFAPDFELDVRSSNMDNANTPEYLNKIKNSVIENLSRTKFGPSVQMTNVPGDIEGMDDEADAELDDLDEDENKDTRYTQRRWDMHVEKDGELSESEDESENKRNGVLRQPGQRKRMNIMDYQNADAVPDVGSGVATPASASLNGDAAVAAVNGELHEDIMKAKASASPPNGVGAPVVGSKNASVAASRASNASRNGDVEMAEASTTVAPTAAEAQLPAATAQLTPPQPPAVEPTASEDAAPRTQEAVQTEVMTVPASAPASNDVEMADAPASNGMTSAAKDEGQTERVEEDANAEAATRVAEATNP